VKSLPLPLDVEDPAIAAVLRPTVHDVDQSSIGARQAGDSLARRPGLTVSRAPPVASPVATPWPSPDVSDTPLPATSTDCPEAAMAVRRRPGTASGSRRRMPPSQPRRRSDSEHAKCLGSKIILVGLPCDCYRNDTVESIECRDKHMCISVSNNTFDLRQF